MDPIHQAIAWLTFAQQIEHTGDQLWAEIKKVCVAYDVEIDTESLDAIVRAAQRRRALWDAMQGGADTGE